MQKEKKVLFVKGANGFRLTEDEAAELTAIGEKFPELSQTNGKPDLRKFITLIVRNLGERAEQFPFVLPADNTAQSPELKEALQDKSEEHAEQPTQTEPSTDLEALKQKLAELEQENGVLHDAGALVLELTRMLEQPRVDLEKIFALHLFKDMPAAILTHLDVLQLLVDYAYRDPSAPFPDPELATKIYQHANKKTDEGERKPRSLVVTHRANASGDTAGTGTGQAD